MQQVLNVNALDYFVGVPGRTFDQLIRFYETLSRLTGSYVQSAQLHDPDVIDEMCKIPESEWHKGGPPPLFGFDKYMHKLTDIADQLIASRAHGDSGVSFYPRPKVPAAAIRKQRQFSVLDSLVADAQKRWIESNGQ